MRNARTRATETLAEGTESRRSSMSTGTRSTRGFGANKLSTDRTFKVDKTTLIIAFLESENFAFAGRHWVDITGDDGKVRKTVKNCLGVRDSDDPDEFPTLCPICARGDTPKATYFFNVVNLANPARVLVWEATTEPSNKIKVRYEAREANGQHLNDDGIYWAVSKVQSGEASGKKGGSFVYSVDPVKERDLPEDWPSLSPLSAESREVLLRKLYDEDYVKYDTFDSLVDFVESIV
jgi:hypothetical protein